MNNFIISDEAIKVVETNLAAACKIMENCDLKPKNSPEVVLQVLSQMYAIESVLQSNTNITTTNESCGEGCCQSGGKLKIVS